MGFLRKVTRQINIKNISPVARVVSVAKPTIKKVIDTKTIGIKDYVALSPVGLSSNLTNTATSTIVDVVMDKPIVPNEVVEPIVDTPNTPTTPTTPTTITPAVTTPEVKKKPNTLKYAGIGVGVLVLGYFGYKLFKK
jgi:hypothetical protein